MTETTNHSARPFDRMLFWARRQIHVQRKPLVRLVAMAILSLQSPGLASEAHWQQVAATVPAIEQELGARLGVAILDTRSGQGWSHHADAAFPLNSTFKVFACAALLAKIDQGLEALDNRVILSRADIVTYSPITEKRVGPDGISLDELCHATMTVSDNSAANMILQRIGGPAGLTGFMRGLGDPVTRLDRWETDLNEARPGDPRDTTSPAAALASLHHILLGDALSPASRSRLLGWMTDNQVAGPLLRASLPADWRIADRTGAGGYGSRSILAMLLPPGRTPVLVAIYLTNSNADIETRNRAIARIGAALIRDLGD